jgi:hypothetical protein
VSGALLSALPCLVLALLLLWGRYPGEQLVARSARPRRRSARPAARVAAWKRRPGHRRPGSLLVAAAPAPRAPPVG